MYVDCTHFCSVTKDAASAEFIRGPLVKYEEMSMSPASAYDVIPTSSRCFASPRVSNTINCLPQSADERLGVGRPDLIEVAGLPLGQHPLERLRVCAPHEREERVLQANRAGGQSWVLKTETPLGRQLGGGSVTAWYMVGPTAPPSEFDICRQHLNNLGQNPMRAWAPA